MNIEEVMIKLGVDSSAIATGMRGVVGMVQDAGQRMRRGLESAFNNLAAPISIAGIGMQFGKVLKMVEDLKAAAESKGVSTGFLQDLQNIGQAAGLNATALDKMLNKFTRTLPVGSDVEQAFMGMADKIAATVDPVERARMATDAFGKSGMEMLRVMSGGSAGIREMAKSFDKLTEAEIAAVEEADGVIDKFQNRITIWAGRAIASIGAVAARAAQLSVGGLESQARGQAIRDIAKMRQEEAAKAAKMMPGQRDMTPEELAEIDKRRAEYSKHETEALYNSLSAQEKIKWHTTAIAQAKEDIKNFERDSTDYYEKKLEIAKEEQKLAEVNKKLSEDERKNAESKAKSEATRKKLMEDIASIQAQQAASYKPSISELSQMPGRNGDTARRIMFLESEIKRAFGAGDVNAANRMITELDGGEPAPINRGTLGGGKLGSGVLGGIKPDMRGLRARLEGIAIDPTQQKLEDMKKELADLNKKLGEGIPVFGKED